MGRHAGDKNEHVHLNPTDADSRLQSWHHLSPEHYPAQSVPITKLNIPKSTICRPDMCIHILPTPSLNLLLLMHVTRIASIIEISSTYADWWRNIHWLVHYLLCGISANIQFEDKSSLVSEPAGDNEHWLKSTGFGDYYYLHSVDTVKYILKDIFMCIIKEQCSDQGESKQKH